MANESITVSLQQLAQMQAQRVLRERVRIATDIDAAADVQAAQGKAEIADVLRAVATSVRGNVPGVQAESTVRSAAPASPYGSAVEGVVSSSVPDDESDGRELPDVQLNDDETDAKRTLRNLSQSRLGGGAGYLAGSIGSLMRD